MRWLGRCAGTALAVFGLAPACTEAQFDPPVMGELCGLTTPVRLLATSPGQQLSRSSDIQRFGDRLVVRTRTPTFHDYGEFLPMQEYHSELHAVGLCGEDPIVIASDFSEFFRIDRWPNIPFGCIDDKMYQLDPVSGQPPRDLGLPCYRGDYRFADDQAIYRVHEDPLTNGLGNLVRHPLPETLEGPVPPPYPLLQNVRTRPAHDHYDPGNWHGVAALRGPEIFAITDDDNLMVLDSTTGRYTLEQPGVRSFSVSADGRYLLWQSILNSGTDPLDPTGAIVLRDRTTSEATSLGDGSFQGGSPPFFYIDSGLVVLGSSVFNIHTLDRVALPPNRAFGWPVDDDNWLLVPSPYGDFSLFNHPEATQTILFSRNAVALWRHPTTMDILDVRGCCYNVSRTDEGPLWRVPYNMADEPPQLLAQRATRYVRRLAAGHLATIVDIDDRGFGTLTWVDPDTQLGIPIADRVYAPSFHAVRDIADDVVVVSVADGPDSGIYLTRLPSLPQ